MLSLPLPCLTTLKSAILLSFQPRTQVKLSSWYPKLTPIPLSSPQLKTSSQKVVPRTAFVLSTKILLP